MTPLVDRLRALSPDARAGLFAMLAETPGALSDVRYDFEGFWARENQIVSPEEVAKYGLIVFTGQRGDGKTQSAVQLFVREILAGRAVRPRIFAATEYDVDKTVIHGDSGIMQACAPEDRPIYIRAEGGAGVLRFRNGVECLCFSAKSAEQAVGSAGDLDLYDDVAKWGAQAFTAWAHARMSCRVGYACGIVATTRRGTVLLRKLLKGGTEGVLIRRGELLSNRFNISPKNYRQMRAELGGTDLYAQEVDDEDTSSSSPFDGLEFEAAPIRILSALRKEFDDIIVAIDPADGKGGDHDEWGVGAAGRRHDRHVVALEDASDSFDDAEAGEAALELCERWGATKIIVETNRGPRALSAMRAAYYKRELEAALTKKSSRPMPELVPITAKEGKRLRAGPLKGLYLQGLLHHVAGLGKLEKQQREWEPDGPKRPRQDDRIDWWVHAVHHLADLDSAKGDPREGFKGIVEAAKTITQPTAASVSALPALFPRSEWGNKI